MNKLWNSLLEFLGLKSKPAVVKEEVPSEKEIVFSSRMAQIKNNLDNISKSLDKMEQQRRLSKVDHSHLSTPRQRTTTQPVSRVSTVSSPSSRRTESQRDNDILVNAAVMASVLDDTPSRSASCNTGGGYSSHSSSSSHSRSDDSHSHSSSYSSSHSSGGYDSSSSSDSGSSGGGCD